MYLALLIFEINERTFLKLSLFGQLDLLPQLVKTTHRLGPVWASSLLANIRLDNMTNTLSYNAGARELLVEEKAQYIRPPH